MILSGEEEVNEINHFYATRAATEYMLTQSILPPHDLF